MSDQAFSLRRTPTASLVFFSSSTLSDRTRGTSAVSSMRWPLDITSAGMPVAAMAEHRAYRFWLVLMRRCQRLQVFVGANMRPPRHMLPKAPWPERWVPPPRTRGMRATARPVPQDSAEVWWPGKFYPWLQPVALRQHFPMNWGSQNICTYQPSRWRHMAACCSSSSLSGQRWQCPGGWEHGTLLAILHVPLSLLPSHCRRWSKGGHSAKQDSWWCGVCQAQLGDTATGTCFRNYWLMLTQQGSCSTGLIRQMLLNLLGPQNHHA